MPSTAISAQGSTLQIDPGTGFVDIANVKSFDGFDGSASVLDATNMSSVAEEIRLGIVKFGSFNFEVDWDGADVGHLALRAAQLSGDEIQLKLTLPDATNATFAAFVMKVPMTGGVDKLLISKIDTRINGAPTWA